MTLVLGSGLLKRIEAPERYLPLGPVVGRVSKNIQQLLARLAVESRAVGQLLQHDHEAELRARLVDQVRHAVVQRIQVLPEMRWKQERLRDGFQDVLFGLG